MNPRWILVLIALFCIGAGKKQPPFSVRFLHETNPRDTSAFAVEVELKHPPRKTFLNKIPIVSEQNVVSVYPFAAADGSKGCAFKLDELGRINLDTLSIEKRGSSLVAFVNGRQIVDMLIDKRITDGVIMIPFGLTEADIALATKAFPVMGAEKKK